MKKPPGGEPDGLSLSARRTSRTVSRFSCPAVKRRSICALGGPQAIRRRPRSRAEGAPVKSCEALLDSYAQQVFDAHDENR
jgi:hypothetical protein